jgi:hypothetical protein
MKGLLPGGATPFSIDRISNVRLQQLHRSGFDLSRITYFHQKPLETAPTYFRIASRWLGNIEPRPPLRWLFKQYWNRFDHCTRPLRLT